jgi:hypothetical protein
MVDWGIGLRACRRPPADVTTAPVISAAIEHGLVVVLRAARLATQGRIRLIAHQSCP